MPIRRDWNLKIDSNQVLRGQGADPDAIRARSHLLVEMAEKAIEEGAPTLDPVLMYRRLAVEAVLHERIRLQEGAELHGKLLAHHLAPASEVIVIPLYDRRRLGGTDFRDPAR